MIAAMTQIGANCLRPLRTVIIGPDGRTNDMIAGGSWGSDFFETQQLKPSEDVLLQNPVQNPVARVP